MNPCMLIAQGLAKSYGDRRVFDGLSFTAPSGFTWIRGANGSGKTSLLDGLAGIEPFDRGAPRMGDVSLATARNAYLERVFYVPNRVEVFPALPIGDLVGLMSQGKGGIDAEAIAKHGKALDVFAAPSRPLASLSFGTQKKLMLSLALASHCPALLLDEPTEGLDAAAVDYLLANMAAMRDRVWIVASHDAEAMQRFDPQIVELVVD